MKTEDEARQSARHKTLAPLEMSPGGAAGGAGTGVSHHPVACIASHCMAWRWYHEPDTAGMSPEDLQTARPIRMKKERGYCGLAGEPHG